MALAAVLQARRGSTVGTAMARMVNYDDLNVFTPTSDRGNEDVDKKNVSVFSFWRDSELHSRGWNDPGMFTKQFSDWMNTNVPVENAVHWVRVVKLCLTGEQIDEKGKALTSEKLLRHLGNILKLPEHLVDDSFTRHPSKMDVFGDKGIFLSLRVQGLRKQKIDHEMLLLMTYWKNEKKANTFGMYEEQVTLFYDPTKNLAISTHQRYFRSSFAKVQDKLKNPKSQIRTSCDSSYMVYATVDCVVDSAFPILEMFADMIKFLEHHLATQDIDDEIIQATGMAISRITDCLKRVRMNQWRIREILTELLQDEWNSFTQPTKDLFETVHKHADNNAQIIDRMLDSCQEVHELRAQKMRSKMDGIVDMLTGISLIAGPMQWWTGFFSVNMENVPFYVWEYSYLIFWIIELVIAGFMTVIFYQGVRAVKSSVGEVNKRVNYRMALLEKSRNKSPFDFDHHTQKPTPKGVAQNLDFVNRLPVPGNFQEQPGHVTLHPQPLPAYQQQQQQLQMQIQIPSNRTSPKSRISPPDFDNWAASTPTSQQPQQVSPGNNNVLRIEGQNWSYGGESGRRSSPMARDVVKADFAFYNINSGALEVADTTPRYAMQMSVDGSVNHNYNYDEYVGYIAECDQMISETAVQLEILKKREEQLLLNEPVTPHDMANQVVLMKRKKRAERTLRELEEKRDSLVDAASAGGGSSAVWYPDSQSITN